MPTIDNADLPPPHTQVVDTVDKKVEKELSDGNAFFQERSYLVPNKRKDAIIVWDSNLQ